LGIFIPVPTTFRLECKSTGGDRERVTLYKRGIGLDIHQAQITACALIEEADGHRDIEQRQFGAFKRDRRELARGGTSLRPDDVVMENTPLLEESLRDAGGRRHLREGGQCTACQECAKA
jgi:hypothetical protein